VHKTALARVLAAPAPRSAAPATDLWTSDHIDRNLSLGVVCLDRASEGDATTRMVKCAALVAALELRCSATIGCSARTALQRYNWLQR
jgi:hypothetical protein